MITYITVLSMFFLFVKDLCHCCRLGINCMEFPDYNMWKLSVNLMTTRYSAIKVHIPVDVCL